MGCEFLSLLFTIALITGLIILIQNIVKTTRPKSPHTPSAARTSAARTSSPKTPVVIKSDYKNCPQCGEEIKTVAIKCKHCKSLLSDQHGSPEPVVNPLNQSNSVPSLDTPLEHKPRGEQLYVETIKMALNLSTPENAEDRVELLNQLIDRYKQALALGLAKEDQVGCHAALSNALLHYVDELNIETPDQVSKFGLEKMPNRLQAVQGFEKALEIDSTNEKKFFGKKVNQAAYLSNLGAHWYTYGIYLKDTKGADYAISYLTNKIRSLGYLGGIYMPDVCLFIGGLYGDQENAADQVEWFKKALSAEDVDESHPQYEHYKKAKQLAKEGLDRVTLK